MAGLSVLNIAETVDYRMVSSMPGHNQQETASRSALLRLVESARYAAQSCSVDPGSRCKVAQVCQVLG